MQKALLIAEKPSLMRTIEEAYNKHRGEIPYEIDFLGQRGHLITLKYPDEIDEDQKEWIWENLPFHPEDHGGWQYKIIEEKKVGNNPTAKDRYRMIKTALNSGQYDFVINAGDPDQEGELLVRIVLTTLRCSLPIKRYWSNDTTEAKVVDALKNLKDDENDPMLVNLLHAAMARQHTDYRFGMNISRAASIKLNSTVSCGRVKSAILGIVCKREEEINNFVPKTCYGVVAKYSEGFTGQMFDRSMVEENEEDKDKDDPKDEASSGTIWFDTEEEAREVIDQLSSPAKVVEFKKVKVETYAPKLFKLATAQIAAGKLGYNSADTLSIIQSLYEKGYISYPRTDCEYISSNENLPAMLKSASSVPELAPFVSSVAQDAINKVRGTKKWVNDKKLENSGHSALVPTTSRPDFASLPQPEQEIYSLICRQFVAIFLPPLVQLKTSLVTDISSKTFRSAGKTLVSPGYTEIFGTKFTDMVIPEHNNGDVIEVDDFDISTKTTTCPKRFTDADLIAVCEAPHKFLNDQSLKKLGKRLMIGTPATRSSIIQELIRSNHYLQESKEKKSTFVIPTDRGMVIWQRLRDLDLFKVDMTGELEEQLEMIRMGAKKLKHLEAEMREHVEAMIKQIKEASIEELPSENAVVGKCPDPNCDGEIISGKNGFYCSNYKKTGCKKGAYKKICDSPITDGEFAKMLAGDSIKKKIRKGDKTWEQELRYDPEECKVVFVQAEVRESEYCCPKCGEKLKDSEKSLYCNKDCGFSLWKTVCGKTLSDEQIDSLFRTGTTGLVSGLTSKKGSKFDAEFIWNDDKTGTVMKFPDKGSAPAAKECDFVCPKCGKNLIDKGRTISCDEDCGFVFWKSACGKTFTDKQIESFFTKGTTGLIKGLTSKKGSTFDAEFVLNEDKTGSTMKFPERKKD